jgi:hypothetical protein
VERLSARLREAWHDPWLVVLAAVLAIGFLLRLYFTLRWRPALVNYSDSGIYIQDAYSGGFADPLRVVGYGIFLIPLHWITPHMLFVILIQHAMGLATAVLLYLAVRRAGAPQVVAIIPAAGVALGGTQIFLEHSLLSEALFIFLVALSLYLAIRGATGPVAFAALAGVCLGLAVTVRGVGTILLAIVPLWIVFAHGRPNRATALRGAASLATGLAIVGGYIVWRHADTGESGLTTNSDWNLYGRAAPFADCTEFTPPAGTEGLCDPVPPSRRVGRNAEWYIYLGDSPAQKLFGPPYLISPDHDANEKLRKFSLAAIRGQPGDYLNAVWQDLIRLVDSNHPSDGDLSYDQFIEFLLNGPNHDGTNAFVESWRLLYYPGDSYHKGSISFLKGYERATRAQGPLMVIALVLALAAPFAAPRRARSEALLFTVTALALLVYPILTHAYDARFVVPAVGPLLAAAALGGWGLTPAAQRIRRAARQPRPEPPPEGSARTEAA